MLENQPQKQGSVLDIPIISRIRRNHGLEHATLHILAQRFPGKSMAGHSNPEGFWILGNLDAQDVRSAVERALERLRAGENQLAIHPNCGTNIVVSGVAAGLAAGSVMFSAGKDRRARLERLPLAVTLATFALVAAQPLGNALQARVTTSNEPGDLRVVDVVPAEKGRIKAHRVVTEG
jgi:hypothetical protein